MARIPDEVMQRLHDTNERFHRARQQLDELDGMNFKEPGEVAQELRAAQLEWEEIACDIHQRLHADDKRS